MYLSKKLLCRNSYSTVVNMTITLDQNGKLQLSKDLQLALNVQPGSEMYVQVEQGKLILSLTKPPELKRIGRFLAWTGEADMDINAAIESVREERNKQVGGF
jgi:hypothetical protein